MEIVSSECIILKNQDFQEQDRLVTFLTREAGRLKGIVKGSRKLTSRGVGSFEPFSRGVMHYTERRASDLVSIRKCDPRPPYLYLQQNYDKILFAGYLAELTDLCAIPPGEAEPYFLLLAEALDALCEEASPRRLPLIRLRFELKLLELLGVQPQWGACCACGQPLLREEDGRSVPALAGRHRFDARAGGVRCPACAAEATGLPALSPETLGFLEAWRGAAPGTSVRPTRTMLLELEAAVTAHLIYHLERVPRALALLPTLAALTGPSSA
jgi:DNA repair protein RecO (recombination protein O)